MIHDVEVCCGRCCCCCLCLFLFFLKKSDNKLRTNTHTMHWQNSKGKKNHFPRCCITRSNNKAVIFVQKKKFSLQLKQSWKRDSVCVCVKQRIVGSQQFFFACAHFFLRSKKRSESFFLQMSKTLSLSLSISHWQWQQQQKLKKKEKSLLHLH